MKDNVLTTWLTANTGCVWTSEETTDFRCEHGVVLPLDYVERAYLREQEQKRA